MTDTTEENASKTCFSDHLLTPLHRLLLFTILPVRFGWGGSQQRAPDPASQPRPRCGSAAAGGWRPSSDSTAPSRYLSPACWTATCWWSGRAARRAGWWERRWPDTAAVTTSPPSVCAGRPLKRETGTWEKIFPSKSYILFKVILSRVRLVFWDHSVEIRLHALVLLLLW